MCASPSGSFQESEAGGPVRRRHAGMSGAYDIMDMQHLWSEAIDIDEDLLDDEGMDDMFSVDLADRDTTGLSVLVSHICTTLLHTFIDTGPNLFVYYRNKGIILTIQTIGHVL